jgi:hypothetical protein
LLLPFRTPAPLKSIITTIDFEELIMKNYFETRGKTQQLVFDPIAKQFTYRQVNAGFAAQRDPLEKHLLADLGIDESALCEGKLKFVA